MNSWDGSMYRITGGKEELGGWGFRRVIMSDQIPKKEAM